MVTNMNIRTAELRDLQALTDIYNHEILNGTATFDLAAVTPEERRPWFDSHNRDNHPLIVADDENGVIHGYASLSPYSQKRHMTRALSFRFISLPIQEEWGSAQCL